MCELGESEGAENKNKERLKGKGASIRNEQIEEMGGEGEGIRNKARVGRRVWYVCKQFKNRERVSGEKGVEYEK